MMASVLALQLVLPLALLFWLARRPRRHLFEFLLQVTGTGAFLLALALVPQWALPVWWLPWVYGLLWLVIVIWRCVRRGRPERGRGSSTAARLLGNLVSLALLALGGWYSAQALSGRTLPPVPVVGVANPFGPGHYLVGHGGSDLLVNGHMRTLDTRTERFRNWRGQSYALDFFGIGPWGLRANGWQPVDPAEYAIFGAALHAPCSGRVVSAESHWPDLPVPEQDLVNRLGNHVILRCGDADIVLAHLRQGSLAVEPDEVVATGDFLGEVGNSGASTEPHLHIHAQSPAPAGSPPLSGEPRGLRIDGRFLVRNDHLTVVKR